MVAIFKNLKKFGVGIIETWLSITTTWQDEPRRWIDMDGLLRWDAEEKH